MFGHFGTGNNIDQWKEPYYSNKTPASRISIINEANPFHNLTCYQTQTWTFNGNGALSSLRTQDT